MYYSKNIINLDKNGSNFTGSGGSFNLSTGADNQIVRYDGTNSIQGSSVILNDNASVDGITSINFIPAAAAIGYINKLYANTNGTLNYKGNSLVELDMITPVTVNDIAVFSDTTGVIWSSGVYLSTFTGTLALLSNGDSWVT